MRLLIVDDDIHAIEGITDSVDWKSLPFDEVCNAASLSQAQKVFAEKSVDILLSDIEMPQGSGLELVEWVRSNYPRTECIFLTCHEDFHFARKALSLGALEYLLKPATPEEIQRTLHAAAARLEERRQNEEYESYGRRFIGEKAVDEEAAESRPVLVVQRAEKFLQEHISDEISVEDIAGAAYVSASHLTRIFHKMKGMTVIEFITEERLRLAKHLLAESGLTITAIAGKVGYNDYSYFTKVFHRRFGMTPSEYRESLKR
jgi:YesN/AraC family two-component response regulator